MWRWWNMRLLHWLESSEMEIRARLLVWGWFTWMRKIWIEYNVNDVNFRRFKTLIKNFTGPTTPGCLFSSSLKPKKKCYHTVYGHKLSSLRPLLSANMLTLVPPRGPDEASSLSHFDYTSLTLTVVFDQGCGVCLLSRAIFLLRCE